MPYLYINSKGQPWFKHSYSAGNTYDQCPYKYFLQKVVGWKEKDNKARFLFGRALEEAIQFYHENDGQGAVEDFQKRWLAHQDKTDILFTKVEKDWENLFYVGTDMIRLYQIRQPDLPIPMGKTVFQKEFEREVFPGDPTYGGIFDAGKLDIIAQVAPDHAFLRKVDWKPKDGPFRPLVVDIKTAATDFSETPGLAAYDKQLRRYSWLSGIRDVALLWFKKCGRKLAKGYSVTLLADIKTFNPVGEDYLVRKAGQEMVIGSVDGDDLWLVHNDFMLEEMKKFQDGKTKEAKARGLQWLEENAYRVHSSQVTRQRLQFNYGYVTPESAADAGKIAERQIKGIVDCWNSKAWPNTFGIRYPQDDRNDPYFLAFVLGEEEYRRQNFKQSAEESLNELFEDPHEDSDDEG